MNYLCNLNEAKRSETSLVPRIDVGDGAIDPHKAYTNYGDGLDYVRQTQNRDNYRDLDKVLAGNMTEGFETTQTQTHTTSQNVPTHTIHTDQQTTTSVDTKVSEDKCMSMLMFFVWLIIAFGFGVGLILILVGRSEDSKSPAVLPASGSQS